MRTNAAGAPAKVVVIMSAIAEWEGLKLLLPDNASRPTPYSESMDVRLGKRDLTFLHSGWDRIASAGALVHDIVELMGDLDIPACYASSLDLSWLADPLPFPVRRGLITSADGATWPRSRAGRYMGISASSTSGQKVSCAGCSSRYLPGWMRCVYKRISIAMSSGSSPS